MKAQTALVLGATGLIGSNLVKLLLTDDAYEKVIVLVRNAYPLLHPKLVVRIVDFNNHQEYQQSIGTGDCIFCCIGTTMKKVKNDKVVYRKIDYDIAVNAAKFGLTSGYSQFLLVSSVGANPASKNFYLQLKGEVEHTILALPFKSIHIFQPSMLLGKRSEFRAAELIGKGIMQVISFLFLGSLKKYRAIQAASVAKAMLAVSKSGQPVKRTYTYTEIIKLAETNDR